MTDRNQQILQQSCALIATEGYAAFSMRAVARASGLKLGALQYHFRTRGDLLNALADFIHDAYRSDFVRFSAERPLDSRGLHALLDYMLVETVTSTLQTHRLFPQLWAMALVEPTIQGVLDDLYEDYLTFIEACLEEQGVTSPRGDALAIMSMFEGLTLFVDSGRRWEAQAQATIEALHGLLNARYGAEAAPPR